MKSSIILILGAAASVCASEIQILQERQTNWTVGQTVQTNSGPVSGHPATNDSQVSEYLGIPYGQPATGALRFAAPVNFTGTAPLNGTKFVSLQASDLCSGLMSLV
jgi:cholinesterase